MQGENLKARDANSHEGGRIRISGTDGSLKSVDKDGACSCIILRDRCCRCHRPVIRLQLLCKYWRHEQCKNWTRSMHTAQSSQPVALQRHKVQAIFRPFRIEAASMKSVPRRTNQLGNLATNCEFWNIPWLNAKHDIMPDKESQVGLSFLDITESLYFLTLRAL